MLKFQSHLVGIDQGDEVLFSDFENGGPMWAEQGPREVRKPIRFTESYTEIPSVTVNLSMWDLDKETNPRADIRAENVGVDGFDLVFRTWSDTRIARARASWQSIGQLQDEDSWALY